MLTPVAKRQKRTKGPSQTAKKSAPAPKEKADRHHEEDGDCGVEAENQMFQGEAPPFLDFDRR